MNIKGGHHMLEHIQPIRIILFYLLVGEIVFALPTQLGVAAPHSGSGFNTASLAALR
jgi:hypothetical protein